MCIEVYDLLIIACDMLIYHINCFQKLPKRLSVSCGIEPHEEGMTAGLRLTRTGSITTCAYGVKTDGRTHLSTDGWKSFLVDKNLHVGQAILITIRKTNRQGFKMMIVIDII